MSIRWRVIVGWALGVPIALACRAAEKTDGPPPPLSPEVIQERQALPKTTLANVPLPDANLARGETYTIEDDVRIDPPYYRFWIRSPHGDYDIASVRKLLKTLQEIDAIERFRATDQGSQAWNGAKESVKDLGRGVEKIIEDPGDAAKGVGRGFARLGRTIGRLAKKPFAEEKKAGDGTDRAKGGVKRSLLCEGSGIPIGLAVDGANRHDMKMVEATLKSVPVRRPESKQNLCLDKGYDYDEVRDLAIEFGYTAHIRARGEEAQAIKHEVGFKARRWVVERTHSWMNRFRRILIRWEKKPENYLALLHFVCGWITYRKLILG